jgi:hypothetical protein
METLLDSYETPEKADRVARLLQKTAAVKGIAEGMVATAVENSEGFRTLEIDAGEMANSKGKCFRHIVVDYF